MSELQKIEAIAKGILLGYYGSTQSCGTEWQKWTYAVLQANKIYHGDIKIESTYCDGFALEYVNEILKK